MRSGIESGTSKRLRKPADSARSWVCDPRNRMKFSSVSCFGFTAQMISSSVRVIRLAVREQLMQVADRALRLAHDIAFRQLALQRHLGEAGTDVVVEVARDAGAFGVHRLAASEDLDLATGPPAEPQPDGSRHHAEAGQDHGDLKPPRLPVVGFDDDVHHGGLALQRPLPEVASTWN
jgi:hypothetical protein